METTYYNEYCQCIQNDPQRCRIKLRKFHSIIFWRFGVIDESSGGGNSGIDRVKPDFHSRILLVADGILANEKCSNLVCCLLESFI